MTNWDSLSSHQKLSLGVFIVIGACAVILWPFLIKKQISLPFARTGNFVLKSDDQLEAERMAKLKTMDTDHDGLSDYDELYLFHTSPFLADSDSDGIPDGVEVAQGTDPNCPQGKVCRQVASAPAATNTNQPTDQSAGGGASTSASATPPQPSDAQVAAVIADTFGDPTKLTPDMVKADIAKMSVSDLRTFLGRLGIPTDALAKADDATLRQLVTDAMNQIATQANPNPTPAPDSNTGASTAPSPDSNSGGGGGAGTYGANGTTNANANANTNNGLQMP